MIKFKGCPKCHGDLYLTKDMYGRYWNCLQCGFNGEPRAQVAGADKVPDLRRNKEPQAV